MAANDRAERSSREEALMRASISAVAPGTALRDGLERTYRWIEQEIAAGAKGK